MPKSVNIGKVQIGQAAIYKLIITNKGHGYMYIVNIGTKMLQGYLLIKNR